MIDRYSKRVSWTKEPGYECLPKSYFVVEYKKNLSKNWTFAGYFDHGVFDLVNVSKGEKFNVRIFAKNVIGSSPASLITFWTNSKFRNIFSATKGVGRGNVMFLLSVRMLELCNI